MPRKYFSYQAKREPFEKDWLCTFCYSLEIIYCSDEIQQITYWSISHVSDTVLYRHSLI